MPPRHAGLELPGDAGAQTRHLVEQLDKAKVALAECCTDGSAHAALSLALFQQAISKLDETRYMIRRSETTTPPAIRQRATEGELGPASNGSAKVIADASERDGPRMPEATRPTPSLTERQQSRVSADSKAFQPFPTPAERQSFFDQLAEERLEPGTSLEYLVGVFLLRTLAFGRRRESSSSGGASRPSTTTRTSLRGAFELASAPPRVVRSDEEDASEAQQDGTLPEFSPKSHFDEPRIVTSLHRQLSSRGSASAQRISSRVSRTVFSSATTPSAQRWNTSFCMQGSRLVDAARRS
ncbi:hypothetical protein JCM8202_005060 [Rhodotorula sphaerocarpa]